MPKMAAPTDIICEVCHERLATHFVSYGSTGKSGHLCDECFGSSVPPEVRDRSAAVREAHCQYCGSQPCTGSGDMFALITGVQKSKYMCIPCSMEYHGFIQQHLSPEASSLSQQEQLTVIRKLLDEADAHMKQWVSEKGSL
jgi:protein-arginine kinase activator protein McsA